MTETRFDAHVAIRGNESLPHVELHMVLPAGDYDSAWRFARQVAGSLSCFGLPSVVSVMKRGPGGKPFVTGQGASGLPGPSLPEQKARLLPEGEFLHPPALTAEKLVGSLPLDAQAWLARRCARTGAPAGQVLREIIEAGIARIEDQHKVSMDTLDDLVASRPDTTPGRPGD